MKDLSPLPPDSSLTDFSASTFSSNPAGSFWDRPFGSEAGWWSVKGLDGRWECADVLTPIDGTRYMTNHNVFFRGE
jgi:hypothetical protein